MTATLRLRTAALAFAAACGALVVLPAVSAQAAPPPTISATPNPVLVPAGQTSANYTLAWTLGGLPQGDFYVSVNGAAQVGPFVQTKDGSNSVAINVGDTHLWKMFGKGDKEKVLATVTVTARTIDASCKVPCIKLAQATPHGTFGHFKIITTSPLVKQLSVDIRLPNVATPVASTSVTPAGNTTHLDLSGLQPNTLYDWVVTATDESGNSQVWAESFKTLRRQVSVKYDPIKVIDDSDDLSAGDLKFWFGFKGKMDTNAFGEVSVDSGHFTFPNHTSTMIDAPATVGLVAVGQDNDCDFFDFCSLPFETPATGPVGHGSDSLSDWATASGSVGVAVDGIGEAFTTTKSIATTSWELRFSVKAVVTVSYV